MKYGVSKWILASIIGLGLILLVLWCAFLYIVIEWILINVCGITAPWFVLVFLVIIVDVIICAITKNGGRK